MHTLLQLNRYFDAHKPWALAKDASGAAAVYLCWRSVGAGQGQLDAVLYTTLETLRVCGILLQPVMPGTMSALLDRLGAPPAHRTRAHAAFGSRAGTPLGPAAGHLFKKFS